MSNDSRRPADERVMHFVDLAERLAELELRAREDGAIVLVKFDGEREKNIYTVHVSFPPEGGPGGTVKYMRRDGGDLAPLLDQAIEFCDENRPAGGEDD